MASERRPLLADEENAHDGHETPPEQQLLDKADLDRSNILTTVPLLLLGVFVCSADTTLVLASGPKVASEFKDFERSPWLTTGFMLSMCATQPLYGKLSDVFGRKIVLSVAYVFFVLGCGMSGLGTSMNQVIAGRVISGAGGAGMTALVSIIIADLVPKRDVAAWRSYVNIAATSGRSLGGPVGGYLTDTVGWRWAFFGQCPLILVALVLVLWRLPSAAKLNDSRSKLAQIDFLGAAFLCGAIVSLLILLEVSAQDVPWVDLAMLAASTVVLAVCFVCTEKWWAKAPIFPLSLFRHSSIVTSYLVSMLSVAGQGGVLFSIPIYFQITENFNVAQAGGRLVPAVIGNAIGGLMSGFLIQRSGRYKLLGIVGPVSSSIGFLLLLLFWNGHTNLWESLYSAPGGFGLGIVQSTTFVQLTAGIDAKLMAIAGTSLFLMQNLGLVLGVSMTTVVLQHGLRDLLVQSLHGVPDREEIIERSLSNLDFVQSLKGTIRDQVVRAYVTSLTYTHGLALGFGVCSIVVALFIREHRI